MILIATGLKREARILAGPDAIIVAGGGDAARLERELEAAAPGARGLVSMGLCGALAEGLAPGDWVVSSQVLTRSSRRTPGSRSQGSGSDGQARFSEGPALHDLGPGVRRDEWSEAWAAVLAERLKARTGPVLATGAMIATAAEKRAAHAATGAIAADMESHVAAAVAARHGLPFAVARVVSDAADRNLPAAAQAGMAADGSMDIGAVLRRLAADPRELASLIRVGREAQTAFRALGRGRHLLGAGVGRADLG